MCRKLVDSTASRFQSTSARPSVPGNLAWRRGSSCWRSAASCCSAFASPWSPNIVLERGASEAALERIDTNMRVAWDALRAHGSKFSIRDGKLYADEHVLNGDVAIVDKVKNLVGGTATIFMKDQRIATNVLKPDGSRAVGTALAKSDAYAAIFDRKASYRGEVQILGEPYMTGYDPILERQRRTARHPVCRHQEGGIPALGQRDVLDHHLCDARGVADRGAGELPGGARQHRPSAEGCDCDDEPPRQGRPHGRHPAAEARATRSARS